MWSLPKQTVNAIIARMVIKKRARLEKVPGTRNRKIIRLTEEGRSYGERLVLPIMRAEGKAYAQTTSEELENITNILGRYIEAVRGELCAATNRATIDETCKQGHPRAIEHAYEGIGGH